MRKPKKECQWEDFCTICGGVKDKICYGCSHYLLIDSGYGWCKFNPEPLIVAWCRDVCSQFRLRQQEH